MRTYVHDNETLQVFFASLLSRLSSKSAYEAIIVGILKDVCNHFRFGCGLVYEVNHAGALELTHHHTVYSDNNPPRNISCIDDCLEKESVEDLKNGIPIASLLKADDSKLAKDINLFFEANSVLISPILDQHGDLAGLVVLLDRRREILLDDRSVDAVLMVMNILANHIIINIYKKRLESTRDLQIRILDNLGINVFVTDMATREIIFVNKPMGEAYGGAQKLIGKPCIEAFQDDNKTCECDFCPGFNNADHGEPDSGLAVSWEHKRPLDGLWFRSFSSTIRWLDGRLANVISSVDITENKRNEEIIRQMAEYDPLTKLPNRRKFFKDCQHVLSDLAANGGSAYLLFFDLDKFKQVNDSMGHPAGDELLTKVGKKLLSIPFINGRVYRYGGDEFVLLYENTSSEEIVKVIIFLLDLFEKKWHLASGAPICHASIGVAQFPDDTNEMETLLYKADQSMYQAKQKGGNMAVFSSGEEIRL